MTPRDRRRRVCARIFLLAGLLLVHARAPHAATLDAVRSAGQLACGVIAEPEDWTKSDLHAGLAPFGAEICRAVAVAALGAHAALDLHVYKTGFEAVAGLRRGEVALALGLTESLSMARNAGIAFGPPVFFDGQGVLVRPGGAAHRFQDLAGARICFIEGTENEASLLAHAHAAGVKIIPLPFQEEGEMVDALAVGHCDAVSAYLSRLAEERSAYAKTLGRGRILSDAWTIDPVAPAYREGDAQWAALVGATVSALIQAEQSGIGRDGVAPAGRNPDDPAVKRLLGQDWAAARALRLSDHGWAATVIATVGNYGEIYARTVGRTLHLPRGENALWTEGGLLYPVPVQ